MDRVSPDVMLAATSKLLDLYPENPLLHYNLARFYSLLCKQDRSLANLARAVDLGYRDFDRMCSDPDLENVRNDDRFIPFLKSALAKDH